jgi:hypothetical protein
VVNSTGSVAPHVVELSNENGLITPRQVYYVSPNLNTISTGAFDISGQSLPIGSGYRIRILTNTPSFFSDYSETFDFVASPDRPVLDYSGSVDLCIGASLILISGLIIILSTLTPILLMRLLRAIQSLLRDITL